MKRPPAPDRVLGDPGNAVHVVAQRDAVPVHAGVRRQVVDHVDTEQVTGLRPDQRAGGGLGVPPGVDRHATQVQGHRAGGEGGADGRGAGAAPGQFGAADGLGTRVD